jgi:hypothetical protein
MYESTEQRCLKVWPLICEQFSHLVGSVGKKTDRKHDQVTSSIFHIMMRLIQNNRQQLRYCISTERVTE